MKNIEIKLSKCMIAISEKDLMECLYSKPQILEQAIKQGKYNTRHTQTKNRQLARNAENFDRWQLYEILKANNIKIDDKAIKWIQGMDQAELREAIIEYLLARNRYIT